MHNDNFYFSVYRTLLPNLTELFLNTIFGWFKIEAKCKINSKKIKSLDNLLIGQISILPKKSIQILDKYKINLQNCDTLISSDKIIFINQIEKIVYRCSANELGSIGIVNNYNHLELLKFNNVPKPIFIQKNDDLTISAESLMSGAEINIKDVTSEMFADIIRQITPLYNINRTFQYFDFQNELNSYDKYFEYYCPLWVEKLTIIKHLIVSSIGLPQMEKIYVCKTLIHGDLTYRNILSDDKTFLFYDLDRSEISYPEFDVYLFYIDWLTHTGQPKYEVLFSNILKFVHNEIHIPHIRVLDCINPDFKINQDVAHHLKYIFLYRMIVLSLQKFNTNSKYPIKLLDIIIKELKV